MYVNLFSSFQFTANFTEVRHYLKQSKNTLELNFFSELNMIRQKNTGYCLSPYGKS